MLLLVSACGKKSDSMSNEEKISGKGEKTWKATKETNGQGDNDKLTRDEKKEKVTFWSNGNVKMGNDNEMMAGTWTYTDNTLVLQFAGATVTENFAVLELEDNKMRLRAGDGSEMTLKPD